MVGGPKLDQGDELVFLTIRCPGEEAPAPGTHRLGTAESDCSASYRRTVHDLFTTIEEAEAVSGSLVVRDSESGPLVAGDTPNGDLSGKVCAPRVFVSRSLA